MKPFLNENEKLKFHLIFLFILSLYYLIPYFFVGKLITQPNDVLDKEVVCDYLLGRFYNGELNSLNLQLGGEIQWFMMWRILQPLSLLFAFFETEVAFWLRDIIVKILAYIFFFKLSRKLDYKIFDSALAACLFTSSSIVFYNFGGGAEMGLGIASLPYIIYLTIKNKTLKIKHYIIIMFIGLNTDLVRHGSIIPIAFLLSLIFFPNYKKYNLKLFIKISSVLLFFILVSSSNLIYAHLFSGPFHRSDFLIKSTDLLVNFNNLVSYFFAIPNINGNPYFYKDLPLSFFVFPIILISFFSKNKKSYQLLLLIFLILFFDFILQTEIITNLRNNTDGLIKTLNLGSMPQTTLPVLYALLFISITKLKIFKKTKYLIYPLLFLSLLTFQMKVSAIPLGKYLLTFNNLSIENQNQLKNYFHKGDYSLLIKKTINLIQNKKEYPKAEFKSKYTFKGYYDYDNYKYIKSLVGNSRTISIGLDPMVAVMNNIKTVGGYNNIYPLSYKLKFRKIIEKQLDYYENLKKYYDDYGQRVYTFVSDPDVININFQEANKLGADYVISKYPISEEILIPVCKKCNNNSQLFLYKIKI